jgi:hypothetical protein
MALVALRDRDHQAEVRVDHPLLGLVVAALDPLGELDLLLLRQQRPASGLVEEELQRIGRRDGEVAVDVSALLALTAAVVADLDRPLLELLVEPTHVVVLELVLLDEFVQLREGEAALRFAVCDQRVDLFSRDVAHAVRPTRSWPCQP